MSLLDAAIGRLRTYLKTYEQPSEPIAFETVRAIDEIVMGTHFASFVSESKDQSIDGSAMSWGINQALRRVIPAAPANGPFIIFPSTETTRAQADDFLSSCAFLERANRIQDLARKGVVDISMASNAKGKARGLGDILIVRTISSRHDSGSVQLSGLRWLGSARAALDRAWEARVAARHSELIPELESLVKRFGTWGMSYSSTYEIDRHFADCGILYLRRHFQQELLAPDDAIGGMSFVSLMGVMAALAGRAEKHLCFSWILKQRHPELSLRNLLTTFSHADEFTEALADHLDADLREVGHLLEHFELGHGNMAFHVAAGGIAWPPIVRASRDNRILPLFGLEIAPFAFLLNELRHRYEKDWFKLANNREGRWITELRDLFASPRWRTSTKGIRLKDKGRELTDIDFAAYDCESRELGLFQLKWSQYAGTDERVRDSQRKNFSENGKAWVSILRSWLGNHGTELIMERLGIGGKAPESVNLFVIGRYDGFNQDAREGNRDAVWADWSHFVRAIAEKPGTGVRDLASRLSRLIEESLLQARPESFFLPLPGLVLVVNPVAVPSSAN